MRGAENKEVKKTAKQLDLFQDGEEELQPRQERELERKRREAIPYLTAPYDLKVILAKQRIWEWKDECGRNGKDFHVSVGGLDSITLLALVRQELGEDVPGVSISQLEDKSVQRVHKEMGVISIPPIKSKVRVLNELGFPVVSKAKANKIHYLLDKDAEKTTFIHAIMTGDMGEQGHFQHSEKIKLPDKWIELFGGNYAEHRPDLVCKVPNFKVSSECCYWMKELPADKWAKEHNSWPFLGLMQSEGGQRELGLLKNGCNYVGKSTARSCPFNYFSRQDLLQLALDLNVHVPEVYGEIVRDPDGTLRTTRAQRTGCSMCGFGIHMEKRPHRFDRLREDNPKEWHFWMYDCCTDENGEKYGWGRVLDWIGVEWENRWDTELVGQESLFE